ncbi:hypothetical protein FOA52_011732 [Chlamydomonas sp. UWO 241]|nr:hypothetical protein FOA52_011732 [Chlamydomonas sp. UWO 241]
MPLTILKDLYDSKTTEAEPKRDKLLEHKTNARDIRAQAKAKRQDAKEDKRDEQMACATARREERSLNEELGLAPSKRGAKDQREAVRQAEHKEEAFTCEHGVSKCRICHPVNKSK